MDDAIVEKLISNIKREIRELTRTEHIEPTYLDFIECPLDIVNETIDGEYDKAKRGILE